MKERPMIFSAESVGAILDGKKSQTRRVIDLYKVLRIPEACYEDVTPKILHDWNVAAHPAKIDGWVFWQTTLKPNGQEKDLSLGYDHGVKCPYGQVGDRLWVRETWRTVELESGLDGIRYLSDNAFKPIENTASAADAWVKSYMPDKWRAPIFMPHWASRITLEITGIRVERVQEISANDALAEGVAQTKLWKPSEMNAMPFDDKWWDDFYFWGHYPQLVYSRLWDSINKKRGYPWEINPWCWVIEFKEIKP